MRRKRFPGKNLRSDLVAVEMGHWPLANDGAHDPSQQIHRTVSESIESPLGLAAQGEQISLTMAFA
jgi:hypothetical protein